MRAILLSVVLVFLAGCGAVQQPVPAYQGYRDYQPQQPRFHLKGKEKRNNTKPEYVAPKEDSRPWDITEDRFLSTHPPDMSSEVLKRTPDEIKSRLKELSKPSN